MKKKLVTVVMTVVLVVVSLTTGCAPMPYRRIMYVQAPSVHQQVYNEAYWRERERMERQREYARQEQARRQGRGDAQFDFWGGGKVVPYGYRCSYGEDAEYQQAYWREIESLQRAAEQGARNTARTRGKLDAFYDDWNARHHR